MCLACPSICSAAPGEEQRAKSGARLRVAHPPDSLWFMKPKLLTTLKDYSLRLFVGQASACAGVEVGDKEDLYLGIRKDDRPNVASIHYHTAINTDLALTFHEVTSNSRKRTDLAYQCGHAGIADRIGYVLAIKVGALTVLTLSQCDRDRRTHGVKRRFIN